MPTITSILKKLTFDDLREWVGDKILNRGRGYIKQVSQLSLTHENDLAAWVTGTEQYATWVRLDAAGNFEYFCTCPYDWGPCKHTVAVILAAADQVKKKTPFPRLDENDELAWAIFGEEEADDEWEEDETASSTVTRQSKTLAKIEKILTGKTREELLGLLMDLSSRLPDAAQHIIKTQQLASGQIDRLVHTLRAEIRNLTAEPAWYDHWSGKGDLPDYTHLAQQLQALADKGHGDALLQLGAELWNGGNAQVEQSDDEGETAMAIAACLETVITALPHSSLSPPQQLLWLIDRMLEDEYSLLDSAEKLLKKRSYTRAHCREVAHTLEERLRKLPKPRNTGFFSRYPRTRLLEQLLYAYDRGGMKENIIPRLEAEAEACQCYGQLVDALLSVGDRDQARDWCIRGYAHTIEESPGIASALQERLRSMAQNERRYDLVAAYRAQDFFEQPSDNTFGELRKTSEKAKCWPAVRTAALHYLESGQHPVSDNRERKRSGWPLPAPEVEPPTPKKRIRSLKFPDLETLIDIAIGEKRFDDVADLYQRLRKTKRWGWETDKTVAQAVANTHPDLALGIWRDIVNRLIDQVKPKAYEEAAIYLRLMKKTYAKTRRLDAWQKLLEELRTKHKAKRRLMGVLDTLSKKKLID